MYNSHAGTSNSINWIGFEVFPANKNHNREYNRHGDWWKQVNPHENFGVSLNFVGKNNRKYTVTNKCCRKHSCGDGTGDRKVIVHTTEHRCPNRTCSNASENSCNPNGHGVRFAERNHYDVRWNHDNQTEEDVHFRANPLGVNGSEQSEEGECAPEETADVCSCTLIHF